MSNIIDLNRFKERADLEKFATAQFNRVVELQKELDEFRIRLAHAEQLLNNPPIVLNSPLTVGTPEEEICKIEIKRLYDIAQRMPLEFEQVKIFDIYVKSLLAIKGKPVEKKKNPTGNFTQEELLKLALEATDDSSEQ